MGGGTALRRLVSPAPRGHSECRSLGCPLWFSMVYTVSVVCWAAQECYGPWGVTVVLGVNPGQAAHTCRGRRVALGYTQETREQAIHNSLSYRNCGIRPGERGPRPSGR